MSPDYLDPFSRLDSPVHRLPAALKLTVALGLVVTVVLLSPSRLLLLGAVAVGVLLVAVLSRIPWPFLVRRLVLLEPLVLGVAFLALFLSFFLDL